MQEIEISEYSTIKLNSYRPLCMNKIGRNAISTYHYPPYIDSSCRREPDFQNEYPSISALCRAKIFAPTLREKDIIVYITKKIKQAPYPQKHNSLVAILQVEEIYPSHQIAQDAYKELNLPIPSNCMVSDNPPYNLDQTGRNPTTSLEGWDNQYLERSKDNPCFIRTRKIYLNLENPAPIFDNNFIDIFGRIPGTRNPSKISKEQLVELARLAEVELIFK